MKSNKIRTYLNFIIGTLVLAYCIKEALGNGDFKVFLEASKLISNDENPYSKWIQVSEGNFCLYFYSPLWAVLLIPFSYLPNFIPNFIWLAINVFCLYRIWQHLKNHIELNSLSKKELIWILLLCAMMSIRFLLYNFGMLQMTVFLLWGSLESIRLIEERKIILGGILLAFVINIKILPIVILPYLIYRSHFKGVASTILFSAFFLMLPAFYLGWTENAFMLTEWWNVINPGNSEHILETELGSHSIAALLATFFTQISGEETTALDHSNLKLVFYLLNLLRFSLICLTLYFLKWPPFIQAANKLFKIRTLSYIFLLIPLIFPHQEKYAFVLILPALFYLNHFIVINYHRRKTLFSETRWITIICLMSLSFILMTLSTDGLIGRELNTLTQQYKTITWGALLLILALVLAKPHMTNKSPNANKI